MSINKITPSELRKMKDSEGLILQGCGGDLKEWLDGINKTLKEEKILLNNTEFKEDNCYVFENENLTCILFKFTNDVNLDIGKLAMWRLNTHAYFAGTWLTDYVDNRLGGFVNENPKPNCALIGEDGNIFNLLGIASRTLKENNMSEEAKEMQDRVLSSDSYEKALGIIGEYVNITSVDEEEYFENEEEMTMI